MTTVPSSVCPPIHGSLDSMPQQVRCTLCCNFCMPFESTGPKSHFRLLLRSLNGILIWLDVAKCFVPAGFFFFYRERERIKFISRRISHHVSAFKNLNVSIREWLDHSLWPHAYKEESLKHVCILTLWNRGRSLNDWKVVMD